MSGRHYLRGPSNCPACGYDPTGDDTEFVSGGGWISDSSISDGIWTDELRCPHCREAVAQKEQKLEEH
ncbi:hypothetical protein ELS19_04490 [Halogeometricum borinquense]|uniref:Small CPxCG-related zinc finger protein n=1 Tax=Halogeometricum borinquense TaxID=60847 RepID=A0A482T8Z6_9EURY|nr:hypothetical protein [Halogeometricum borinquense]RYJ13297.1 hypothetical protein ELS19_04490 [Halogeometricum borinquense]